MANSPVIGIDLGTTFSCVSVYRRGRPELIPNSEGDRLTPSLVYFDPDTGEVSVGHTANELLPRFPKNGLLDAKRFIGRKFDDEFITKYIKSKEAHFCIVRDEEDKAAYEIEINGTTILKKPEEVSSEILKYLKTTASEYLGEAVERAIISVPAYFSNAQRKATMVAAELAGLTVLKLITEPTAAAIHYASDRNRDNSNLLVFDFGGGTLDVSLINVKDTIFEVKAVYGDSLLGGRNVDVLLFEHFYKKILNADKTIATDKRFKRRLSEMCVNLKKKLSPKQEFTYFLDRYNGNSDLIISMTRSEFEEMMKDLFQDALAVVELSLSDSCLTKSDIDEVILVGGSTRIPKLRKMLSESFGSEKIKSDLNPDEAVAAGASIHAAFLTGDYKDLENYKVTEVTPMSLGIEVNSKLMSVFLPKHSALPATVQQKHTTLINNQKALRFSIFEGERKNVDYNRKLGELIIENLPEKRAGDVTILVDFQLDENGILSVTASETSTGISNNLVVTLGEFRLSDNKIKSSLEDALKHKAEDERFEQFVILLNMLQRKVHHVLYDVEVVTSTRDKKLLIGCCESFLENSNNMHPLDPHLLMNRYLELYDAVSNILLNSSTTYNVDFLDYLRITNCAENSV